MTHDAIKMCRCPACNPMNGGGQRFGSISPKAAAKAKLKAKKNPCIFCKGTERVEVERAQRWMEAATGVSPCMGTSVNYSRVGYTSNNTVGMNFGHEFN